jgi:hypothetical protein
MLCYRQKGERGGCSQIVSSHTVWRHWLIFSLVVHVFGSAHHRNCHLVLAVDVRVAVKETCGVREFAFGTGSSGALHIPDSAPTTLMV